MAQIVDVLSRHSVIGLDTMIFVYGFEAPSPLATLSHDVLDAVETGTITAVTSDVTIMEMMVRPLQLGRPEIAAGYEDLLTQFPNLTIAPLARAAVRQAAELRARFGLQALDALQLAACITSGATAFVTNDLRLRRVTDMDIVILDDFLSSL